MPDTSPALKTGQNLRGEKKGSRLAPLLILVVVIVTFGAFAIQRSGPELTLQSAASDADIPTRGRNQVVVARVGQDAALRFRIFDEAGNQVAETLTETEFVAKVKAGGETDFFKDIVLDQFVKPTVEQNWGKAIDEVSRIDKDVITIGVDLIARPKSRREYGFGRILSVFALTLASDLARDVPALLRAQVKTIWILSLYALVPGFYGMIYRRAFWTWFVGAFVILFVVNWGLEGMGIGSVAPVSPKPLDWIEGLFRVVEELAVLSLIAFRLRRESASAMERAERRPALLLAALLLVLAFAGVYWLSSAPFSRRWWHGVEGVILLLVFAWVLLRQTRPQLGAAHGKNIVVCLDGTWFYPGQKDFDRAAVTNVFKLFEMCKGRESREYHNASRCKVYDDMPDGATSKGPGVKQVAFYYQGVGNIMDYSAVGQILGGASGLGASGIVERAYLDVVKVYRPGDRIFIFGFSRGAAIGRLLAGAIATRGVPMSLWTLRLFGRYFLLWKSARALDVHVDVLGCWDTVGSFGIPKTILGIPFQRIHLLKDLTVSTRVKRAYHMVALDETRDSFQPTLMDPDPTAPHRIVEVWFSGSHSDVGGGYATDNLSDVALDFLLRHVSSGYAWDTGQSPGDESWGLYVNAVLKGRESNRAAGQPHVVDPNPLGPIRQPSGALYSYAPRRLPTHSVIFDGVFNRMSESLPVYAPQSVFDLNREFVRKREDLEAEVKRLVETESVDVEQSQRILQWGSRHLSLTRWSEYLEFKLDDSVSMGQALNPAVELRNPPGASAA